MNAANRHITTLNQKPSIAKCAVVFAYCAAFFVAFALFAPTAFGAKAGVPGGENTCEAAFAPSFLATFETSSAALRELLVELKSNADELKLYEKQLNVVSRISFLKYGPQIVRLGGQQVVDLISSPGFPTLDIEMIVLAIGKATVSYDDGSYLEVPPRALSLVQAKSILRAVSGENNFPPTDEASKAHRAALSRAAAIAVIGKIGPMNGAELSELVRAEGFPKLDHVALDQAIRLLTDTTLSDIQMLEWGIITSESLPKITAETISFVRERLHRWAFERSKRR